MKQNTNATQIRAVSVVIISRETKTKMEDQEASTHSSHSSQRSTHRALHDLVDEKRAFESEAETSILRAIGSNEQKEVNYHHDFSRSRTTARARASMVSKLPPLMEDGSTKTFGLVSESSLSISVAPKLTEIAHRIKTIQQESRRRSTINRQRRSLVLANHGKAGHENYHSGDRPHLGRLRSILSLSKASSQAEIDDESSDREDIDMIADDEMIRESMRTHRHWYLFSKFVHFLKTKKQAVGYVVKVIVYGMIPLIGVSAILFYFAGNPIGFLGASYSWWILFFVRQGITFLLARSAQFILIDLVVLETQLALMIFGRVIALIAMQAKGWPTLMLFWSIWNYGLLYGKSQFVQHWLYWQNSFALFNEANPSGNVTTNDWYTSFLVAFGVCSFLAMIKRVLVAMLLGGKKYGALYFS